MNRSQIESISRSNARAIIKGKDKLKSYGHSGSVYLSNLKKHIHYRSMLERSIFEKLDKIPSVIDLESEGLRIEYWWKGAILNYVPDIIIKLKSGVVWILEVKPKSRINDPKNKAKFIAAREFCRTRGNHLEFGVVTSPNDLNEMILK